MLLTSNFPPKSFGCPHRTTSSQRLPGEGGCSQRLPWASQRPPEATTYSTDLPWTLRCSKRLPWVAPRGSQRYIWGSHGFPEGPLGNHRLQDSSTGSRGGAPTQRFLEVPRRPPRGSHRPLGVLQNSQVAPEAPTFLCPSNFYFFVQALIPICSHDSSLTGRFLSSVFLCQAIMCQPFTCHM